MKRGCEQARRGCRAIGKLIYFLTGQGSSQSCFQWSDVERMDTVGKQGHDSTSRSWADRCIFFRDKGKNSCLINRWCDKTLNTLKTRF